MKGLETSVALTLVNCAAFDGEWAALVRQIDAFIPEDLVSRMVELPSAWSAVEKFEEEIISLKDLKTLTGSIS